jgi:hypothetical protein
LPRLRTIGPQDQGHEIVLHYGDRLTVVPASRAGGWAVADFPTGILRLQGDPRAATSHTFVAIAVGDGQLTLAPSGPEARSTGVYTVRIKVLRGLVVPPRP